MKRRTFRFLVALSIVSGLSVCVAATMRNQRNRAIGLARTSGVVRIDDSKVSGNGTLLNGSRIETSSPSEIFLDSGSRIALSSGFAGRIYGEQLVIERGSARVQNVRSPRALQVVDRKGEEIGRVQPGRIVDLDSTGPSAAAAAINRSLSVAQVHDHHTPTPVSPSHPPTHTPVPPTHTPNPTHTPPPPHHPH